MFAILDAITQISTRLFSSNPPSQIPEDPENGTQIKFGAEEDSKWGIGDVLKLTLFFGGGILLAAGTIGLGTAFFRKSSSPSKNFGSHINPYATTTLQQNPGLAPIQNLLATLGISKESIEADVDELDDRDYSNLFEDSELTEDEPQNTDEALQDIKHLFASAENKTAENKDDSIIRRELQTNASSSSSSSSSSYNQTLSPLSPEYTVTTFASDANYPRVVYLPTVAKFLVTWGSDSKSTLYGRLLDANGVPEGSVKTLITDIVATVIGRSVYTVLDNGNIVFAWSISDIYLQMFDPISLNAISPTEQPLATDLCDNYCGCQSLQISSTNNGGFTLSWVALSNLCTDDYSTIVQFFNSNLEATQRFTPPDGGLGNTLIRTSYGTLHTYNMGMYTDCRYVKFDDNGENITVPGDSIPGHACDIKLATPFPDIDQFMTINTLSSENFGNMYNSYLPAPVNLNINLNPLNVSVSPWYTTAGTLHGDDSTAGAVVAYTDALPSDNPYYPIGHSFAFEVDPYGNIISEVAPLSDDIDSSSCQILPSIAIDPYNRAVIVSLKTDDHTFTELDRTIVARLFATSKTTAIPSSSSEAHTTGSNIPAIIGGIIGGGAALGASVIGSIFAIRCYLNRKTDITLDNIGLTELNANQFEDPEVLGKGAFGTVYKANWKGIAVAVKQLDTQWATSEEISAYKQEAQTMKEINHPNLVKCFASFQDEKNFYIVMQLMEGGTLEKYISVNKDHPNSQMLDKFMKQIVAGMAYLHEANLIHRDLKTANVLLTSNTGEANAAIGDFGTARLLPSQKTQRTMTRGVGTPVYMAPEILNREHYSKEADVFSFAMILLMMSSGGKEPYADYDYSTFIPFVVAGGREKIPDTCPPKMAGLIAQCWTKRPEERPTFQQIQKSIDSTRISFNS